MKNTRVVVTGGSGFLGSHLVEKLKWKGAHVSVPRSKQYNLIGKLQTAQMYKDFEPEILIHLAATVGGIGANRANPGLYLYNNAMMGMNILEEARKHDVEKVVVIGTICAYPKFTPVPFKEEDLWMGYPEETNAPYGVAKKLLLVQAQAYRQQYGLNAIYLLPVNLYGPRDNFHPDSSHVIPALIKKCVDAIEQGQDKITVWGTGTASREFLYVEDAAEGILHATEKYNKPEPINLGSGKEITIKDLVQKICFLTGFKGKVEWDTTNPDGQPRRCLDVSKAKEEFGFVAKTDFDEGLRRTIEWYRKRME